MSRTDNAVRNMYYIGYTSSIAGNAQDNTVYEYLKWCYGADGEEEELMEYPVGYFFSGENSDARYMLQSSVSQMGRQLYSQYPPQEVMERTAIMRYFDADANKAINQMWINVRCFDIEEVPMGVWLALLAALLFMVSMGFRKSRRR